MRVLLGSNSPRRRELMAGLDIPFRVVSVFCDEHFPAHLTEGDIPLYLAEKKADAYNAALATDEILLTADTIVWADGCMLGKPTDEADAKRMLHLLSGRTHQVYTGVCLRACHRQTAFVDCTDVSFRPLSDDEINRYVRMCHPLDKAGAYGVQEWIGYVGVTAIQGSYFNVMGLPVHRVWEELMKF